MVRNMEIAVCAYRICVRVCPQFFFLAPAPRSSVHPPQNDGSVPVALADSIRDHEVMVPVRLRPDGFMNPEVVL